jgi:hypothetical protein
VPGHVDRRQRRRDGFRQAGCASYFLEVPWPLEDSEKAARRDDAQSEDLPAKRVSILRTKERYVPDVCAAVGDPPWAAYAMRHVRGMYRLWPIHPAFCICFPEDILFSGSSAHWSPSAPTPAGTRRQRECGSRPPTGSAVSDGRGPPPSPWERRPGFGVAGNRGLTGYFI